MAVKLTDAQLAALAVIDASATGDAAVGRSTSMRDMTVSSGAAKSLERLGLCEVTMEVVYGATSTGGYARDLKMGTIRRVVEPARVARGGRLQLNPEPLKVVSAKHCARCGPIRGMHQDGCPYVGMDEKEQADASTKAHRNRGYAHTPSICRTCTKSQ